LQFPLQVQRVILELRNCKENLANLFFEYPLLILSNSFYCKNFDSSDGKRNHFSFDIVQGVQFGLVVNWHILVRKKSHGEISKKKAFCMTCSYKSGLAF